MEYGLSNLELKRKSVHIFAGVFAALFYYFGLINWMHVLVIIIIGFLLSNYLKKHKVPFLDWFLERMDRKEDRIKFPGKGAIFLMIGIFLSIIIFPKNIAVASIMILALGDGVSALLGQFGKYPHPFNRFKFIEGTIAGIISGTIGAAIFVPFWQGLIASIFAMTFEAMDIVLLKDKIDDNLIVPVVAGAVLVIIMRLYKI